MSESKITSFAINGRKCSKKEVEELNQIHRKCGNGAMVLRALRLQMIRNMKETNMDEEKMG